ncbi:MAG: VCBS repeat-containing protein [Acidobacteria bacterium]|nr:VCBS repeat-containing protein [Acidobacteriota bacterium]
MKRNPSSCEAIFGLIAFVLSALFVLSCASGIKLSSRLPWGDWSEELGPVSSGGYYGVAVGDFNGDGIPDLAAGSFQPGGIRVWVGKGDGSFVEINSPLSGAEVHSVKAIDFDKDGNSDLVASFTGEERGVAVFISKGDGRWEAPLYLSTKNGFEGVAIGDFDEDGKPDVAAANLSPGSEGGVYVWLNRGDRNWLSGRGPRSSGSFRAVASGDLNHDGHLDIVATELGLKGALLVWLGDGKGGWSPSIFISKGKFSGLSLADIDGDGWLDVLASLYPEGLAVFFNHKGSFNPKPRMITDKGSFYGIVAGDIDRRAGLEVLASSLTSQGIIVFSFRGKGFKEMKLGLAKENVYYGITLGDLNLDGLLDIIAGSYDEGVQVWLQTVGGKIKVLNEVTSRFSPPIKKEKRMILSHLVTENMVFTTKMGFPEYRIAPQDELRINFWTGAEEKSFKFTVENDGTIFIPFMNIGTIKVAGFSATELKQELLKRVRKFIRLPAVEVKVTKYVGHRVSILGEVMATAQAGTGPGKYPLTGKTDLISFISQHGGATPRGDLSRVRLTRRGKTVVLNLFRAISQGDLTQNPILDDGDVIYIPSLILSENRALVLGEVNKPGIIELREGTRLLEAISKAGSFTKDANLKQVFVVRGNYLKKPEIIVVDLTKVLKGVDVTQNIPLSRDDIVYVPRSFFAKISDFIKVFHPALTSVYTIYTMKKLSER